MADSGLDLTEADRIVGTSAGATAAAQITGADAAELYRAALAPVLPTQTRPPGFGRGTAAGVVDHLELTSRIIAAAADPAEMRRRVGAAAIDLASDATESTQSRWRATVAARLPQQGWPLQELLITAVDAKTGAPVKFRRDDVPLADAVAASGASAAAYRIGEHHYIDGGYRTNADNADLATGYAQVIVLSPFAGQARTPQRWHLDLASQVAALRTGGSRVEILFPAPNAEHMFGANAMNLRMRPAAARAGYEQGKQNAERLTELWGG